MQKVRDNTVVLLDESMKNFCVANKNMRNDLNQIIEAMDKMKL